MRRHPQQPQNPTNSSPQEQPAQQCETEQEQHKHGDSPPHPE